jgi:hypothetical protein
VGLRLLDRGPIPLLFAPMSSPEIRAVPPADEPADEPGAGHSLTITEAAVAFGVGRRSVRNKLHAGEFPHATKDDQGFWRIPEGDLLAAGMRVSSRTSAPVNVDDTDAMKLLSVEVLELRHRVERAEALLDAERKLSDERARALDTERATVDALYRQMGRTRPVPKPPESARADWQASMRAARERDLQQRAEREREARRRRTVAEPPAPPNPVPAEAVPVSVSGRGGESATSTDTVDASAARHEPERRHRWRRR